MTKLQPENTSRKLDSLGRVVIPKSLRDKQGINENDEIYFYTITEDGQNFIALTNGKTVDPKYAITANVLEELGVEAPQQLLDMINNKQLSSTLRPNRACYYYLLLGPSTGAQRRVSVKRQSAQFFYRIFVQINC